MTIASFTIVHGARGHMQPWLSEVSSSTNQRRNHRNSLLQSTAAPHIIWSQDKAWFLYKCIYNIHASGRRAVYHHSIASMPTRGLPIFTRGEWWQRMGFLNIHGLSPFMDTPGHCTIWNLAVSLEHRSVAGKWVWKVSSACQCFSCTIKQRYQRGLQLQSNVHTHVHHVLTMQQQGRQKKLKMQWWCFFILACDNMSSRRGEHLLIRGTQFDFIWAPLHNDRVTLYNWWLFSSSSQMGNKIYGTVRTEMRI